MMPPHTTLLIPRFLNLLLPPGSAETLGFLDFSFPFSFLPFAHTKAHAGRVAVFFSCFHMQSPCLLNHWCDSEFLLLLIHPLCRKGVCDAAFLENILKSLTCLELGPLLAHFSAPASDCCQTCDRPSITLPTSSISTCFSGIKRLPRELRG